MRVGTMVRELVGQCSSVMHAVRLATVMSVVEGIIRSGALRPATIGRSVRGSALPKHEIKRVDRLLGNPKMIGDRLFLFVAIAHRVLRGAERPVILVDWTQACGTHVALVAAVPIGGRAVPIYSEVHPLKKLGNAAVERRFIRTLKAAIVPTECRSIIVSDAGFKGPFFEAVVDVGWDFLGRVRGTTKAISSTGEKISKEQFYARASITPIDLGAFRLFVNQRIPCRLVLVRKRRRPGPKRPPPACKEERELRQSALDPWLLATSLSDGDAAEIVRKYASRMQIEETFRDAKSYYVVRANALENNVRLYRMVNGRRIQFAGFNTPVTSGQWHTLRVVSKGDRITCYFDGKQVIDAQDKTYSNGKVGLWTKADSVIAFNDLTITP